MEHCRTAGTNHSLLQAEGSLDRYHRIMLTALPIGSRLSNGHMGICAAAKQRPNSKLYNIQKRCTHYIWSGTTLAVSLAWLEFLDSRRMTNLCYTTTTHPVHWQLEIARSTRPVVEASSRDSPHNWERWKTPMLN